MPWASSTASWKRAVRRDSLGYRPLHRSSVGWLRPTPPGNTTTSALAGTSSGVTIRSSRADAEGSLPAESGMLVEGPGTGRGGPGLVVGAGPEADGGESVDERLDR